MADIKYGYIGLIKEVLIQINEAVNLDGFVLFTNGKKVRFEGKLNSLVPYEIQNRELPIKLHYKFIKTLSKKALENKKIQLYFEKELRDFESMEGQFLRIMGIFSDNPFGRLEVEFGFEGYRSFEAGGPLDNLQIIEAINVEGLPEIHNNEWCSSHLFAKQKPIKFRIEEVIDPSVSYGGLRFGATLIISVGKTRLSISMGVFAEEPLTQEEVKNYLKKKMAKGKIMGTNSNSFSTYRKN